MSKNRTFSIAIVILSLLIPSGTEAQMLVKDISPEPYASSLDFTFAMVEINGKGFFNAHDGVHGMEPWITDGTEAGTYMLKDINTTPNIGSIIYDALGENWTPLLINGKILFPAYNEEYITELWVSDGTEEGTELLLDIHHNGSSYPGGINVDNFIYHNNEIWFSALDENGNGIWKTDGTTEGTMKVGEISVGAEVYVTSLTVFNNAIYFIVGETELWRCDGTAEGTILLQSFNDIGNLNNNGMIATSETLFFYATDNFTASELWTVDTEENITLLDVTPGAEGTYPSQLTVLNDQLFFTGYDPVHDRELWTSDGTVEGTYMVKDINTAGNSFINFPVDANTPLFVWQGEMWFSATDDANGRELWRSNGTAEGTFMEAALIDGFNGSDPHYFTVHDDKLFFTARLPFQSGQLYSYNYQTDEMVSYWMEGWNDNACCSAPFTSVGSKLYLNGNYDFDDVIATELYVLDTAIDEVGEKEKTNFTIYPNPSQGQFTLVLNEIKSETSLIIADQTGRKIHQQKISGSISNIDALSVSAGIYSILLEDGEGIQFLSKMVIE